MNRRELKEYWMERIWSHKDFKVRMIERFRRWYDFARDRQQNMAPRYKRIENSYTLVGAILSFGFFCFWVVRATKVSNFGDDFETLEYDQCGNFAKVPQEDIDEICADDPDCMKDIDTAWGMVFEFNAVLMGSITVAYIILLTRCKLFCTAFAGFCGITCNTLLAICIIVTGAKRYSLQG